MKKPELETHVRRSMDAIGDMLAAIRGPRETCRLCDVTRGVQHKESCPTWPLILARSAFRSAEEAETPCSGTLL